MTRALGKHYNSARFAVLHSAAQRFDNLVNRGYYRGLRNEKGFRQRALRNGDDCGQVKIKNNHKSTDLARTRSVF